MMEVLNFGEVCIELNLGLMRFIFYSKENNNTESDLLKYVYKQRWINEFLWGNDELATYINTQLLSMNDVEVAKTCHSEANYVLLTTFQTNGFSVKCLVHDVTKPKTQTSNSSELSYLDQSKVFTRRKYPESDDLPDKSKRLLEWTLGENLLGDLCAKTYPPMKLIKKKNHYTTRKLVEL
jgi:hypothetical protein